METNLKLFDECLNTIAANSVALGNPPYSDVFISNQHACISIVHNFLKGNVLDEKRRDKLQNVLFQYAVADVSASGVFSEYTSDNRCPDMTVEDYIETVFLEGDHYCVGEAYGDDEYNIWHATLSVVREMLIVLRPNTLSKTQQKHFYNCLKKLVSNDEIETKNNGMIMKHGFMRNRDAYMSIIYNYFKTCKLSEHDRDKLKEVLFDFAVAEFSSNGDFGDYKHDKRCPDLTIQDYVVKRFLRDKKITVENADSGCGGYNICSGTHALLREMLNTLNE